MTACHRFGNDDACAQIARELEAQHADLLAAVERWATGLACNADVIAEVLAAIEDVFDAPLEDEVARRRASRGLGDALIELGGLAAALRLGPPETVGHRLQALVSELSPPAS